MIDIGAAGSSQITPWGPEQQYQPPQPQQPQQGGGVLGLNLRDPLNVALLLAPLGEVLRHGAGAAIYDAALRGTQYRQQAQERSNEFQQNLDLRNRQLTDAAATRTQATQEHRARLTETYLRLRSDPRTAHLADAMLPQLTAAGVTIPEMPPTPAAPTIPTFGDYNPRTRGTPLEHTQIPWDPQKGQPDWGQYQNALRAHGLEPAQPAATPAPEAPQVRQQRVTQNVQSLFQDVRQQVEAGSPSGVAAAVKAYNTRVAEAQKYGVSVPFQAIDPAPLVQEATLRQNERQANLTRTQAETGRIGVLNAREGAATPKQTPEQKKLIALQDKVDASERAVAEAQAALDSRMTNPTDLTAINTAKAALAKAQANRDASRKIVTDFVQNHGGVNLGLNYPQQPGPFSLQTGRTMGANAPTPQAPGGGVGTPAGAEAAYRAAGYVPKEAWRNMSPAVQTHLKRVFGNVKVQ